MDPCPFTIPWTLHQLLKKLLYDVGLQFIYPPIFQHVAQGCFTPRTLTSDLKTGLHFPPTHGSLPGGLQFAPNICSCTANLLAKGWKKWKNSSEPSSELSWTCWLTHYGDCAGSDPQPFCCEELMWWLLSAGSGSLADFIAGLNPCVNGTKGTLTKYILCPEWLSPCHQALPHAFIYANSHTHERRIGTWSTHWLRLVCAQYPSSHMCFSWVPGEQFFHNPAAADLYSFRSAPLWW